MATDQAKSVGQVVGENLARARESRGQTQREAGRYVQEMGLKWSAANIAAIESGRRHSVDLASLTLLSVAYERPLAAWFEGQGQVTLADGWSTSRADLRKALSQLRAPSVQAETIAASQAVLRRFSEGPGLEVEADLVICQRLNVHLQDVIDAAHDLWGHTATVERDRRLGAVSGVPKRTVQARRGHITRRLADELAGPVKPYAQRRQELAERHPPGPVRELPERVYREFEAEQAAAETNRESRASRRRPTRTDKRKGGTE